MAPKNSPSPRDEATSAESIRQGTIALVGRPNAGKSTLLNAIFDSELSIVSEKAQTTRDQVLGIYSEEDCEIVFLDTPGIHLAKEEFNRRLVAEADRSIEESDLVWYLTEFRSKFEVEAPMIERLEKTKKPFFLIINKLDLFETRHEESKDLKRGRLEAFEALIRDKFKEQCLGVMHLSAKNNEGVTLLVEKSKALLSFGPRHYEDRDQMTDRPMRFFASEHIRKSLFECLGEELPYSCAVRIDAFREDGEIDEKGKKTKPSIDAVIYVERDSQKGMVVGRGGQKIKEIGIAARKGIEKLMGRSIVLRLKVAVLKDWTKDPKRLDELGIGSKRR